MYKSWNGKGVECTIEIVWSRRENGRVVFDGKSMGVDSKSKWRAGKG